MSKKKTKVGKALQKAAQTAKKVVKKAGRLPLNMALAPLLPVLPTVALVYKRKTGKKPPLEPLELVKAFARDVLKKKFYDLEPATIVMLVTAILSFIANEARKAREKKAQGQPLSPEEEQLAQASISDAQAAQGQEEELAQIGSLLPLMRTMYQERTKRQLPSDPYAAIKAFYQDVVLPSQSQGATYEFDYAAFEAMAVLLPPYDYDYEYSFDVKTAIAGIIAFFRAIRDSVRSKEAQGLTVSQTEKAIADRVDAAERQVQQEVSTQIQQQVQQKAGQTLFQILPYAAIAIVAYFLFFKKR
ncbi:MAG: hypothetical protein N2205_06425 [Candidatus Caldatribacterium sp.]|nr:hypothetical protein [Candidatus Caldatribacterium sp.]